MPQPLSKVAPLAGLHVANSADDPSRQRPELAVAAMAVITSWSNLESAITRLFVSIIKDGVKASAAIFTTIRGQQRQHDAIRAVARAFLTDDRHRDLVIAVVGAYADASTARNRLAHWIWGTTDELPDAILLADPLALATFEVDLKGLTSVPAGHVPILNRDRIFVYTKLDLEEAAKEIQRAVVLVMRTSIFIAQVQFGHANDQEYFRLSSEPAIRRRLDNIRRRGPPSGL